MDNFHCLLKVDDINYKITLKLDKERITGNFDDFLRAITMDTDPDLKKYDFTQEFFIFEIYDKPLNEWVRIDDETEIENMSKIRVKILDINEITAEPTPPTINEEELSFVELSDYKEDIELVEIYAQTHVPDDDIIKIVDNSNVTAESFSVQNIRVKKQMIKTLIKYQGLFATPGTFHDNNWDLIVEDIKDNLGSRVIRLIYDRPHLGFVRINSRNVQREFTSLIGQYNRLLRMCQCLTAQLAERLWPLFKIFHKSLRIDYIYPERGPSLKIMQKEFDNAKKITVLND